MLVPPSPKLHCQMEGLPVDASVNCTDCPATGEAGLKLKEAEITVRTDTVRLTVFESVLLLTVNVTVLDPAVA